MEPDRARRFVHRWLYPLGRLQYTLAARRWTKLLAAPVFVVSVPRMHDRDEMLATILDYFGPGLISTATCDDVELWLRRAGISDVERLPVPISVLARKAHRPGSAARHDGVGASA
jgi:hypothetical protein